MNPTVKPLPFATYPPPIFHGPCQPGRFAGLYGCEVYSPCPRGKALVNDACVWSPPPEGYLCSNLGNVYRCGGVNQPEDPCYQGRSFVPNNICIVVPTVSDLPEPGVGVGDGCPVVTLGLFMAILIDWACP